MASIPKPSAQWRAKTMIFCLNVQFCLWVLPLTELFTGRSLVINIYYFVLLSIFILSICFFLKYRYVDRAVANLNEMETGLKYNGLFNYASVLVVYLTAFGGFVFLVECARKVHGS